MLKPALGVVVALFAFVFPTPTVHAEGNTVSKASTDKQSAKKSVASPKNGATYRSAKERKTSAAVSSNFPKKNVATQEKRKAQHFTYAPSVSVARPVLTAGEMAGLHMTRDPLALKSNAALVFDPASSQVLFEKNPDIALPIASLTKLMTALIVVEARQDMDEVLEVTADDIDREKNTSSRLRVGAQMTRADMLHIALMSSENRAASALGRNYPGGLRAFVAAMNAKAKSLGMNDSRFVEPTGLSSNNVASARDLAKLVIAAHQHPIIREYSTAPRYAVDTGLGSLHYMNSNPLVRKPGWDIGLQKTGYISEAGRCLVMHARIDGYPVVMVFLDSKGKEERLADANRIRRWLEISKPQDVIQVVTHRS